MVAWAGIERLRLGALDDPTDMEVRARWPLGVSPVPRGDGKVTSTKHTKLTSTRAVTSAGGPAAVSGIEGVPSDSGARTTGFAPTENQEQTLGFLKRLFLRIKNWVRSR